MGTPYIGIAALSWFAYNTLGLYYARYHAYPQGELHLEDHVFVNMFALFGAIIWPFTWTALTIAYLSYKTFKKLEQKNQL